MAENNYTRRDFLKGIGLGSMAMMVLPRCAELARRLVKQVDKKRPNIVLIMADDMGFGDLGCYGATKIPTPNIDRLASKGIRFTDAHTPSALCTPTRYGVLTGRYCWRTRLKKIVASNFASPLIEPQHRTIASLLKNDGYATACIGKWHLGLGWAAKEGEKLLDMLDPRSWNYKEQYKVDFSKPITGGPLELGFDYFFGISGANNMLPYCFIENDYTIGIPSVVKRPTYDKESKEGLAVPGWKQEDIGPTLTKKAIGFIKQHVNQKSSQPFFLYFPTSAVHRPCIPPKFIKGRSQAGLRGDMVAEVDWTVGEVLKTLNQLKIRDNTLVIVTSDNGAQPGDPEHFIKQLQTTPLGHKVSVPKEYKEGDAVDISGRGFKWVTYGHKPNGDWRGYKSDIWEGGHRVPFIALWPGKIKPGSTSDELICLTDFMATFAAIVREELPDYVAEDSYNVLSSLLSQKRDRPIRESIVLHSGHGIFAIRKRQWKLIFGRGSGGESKPVKIKPKPGESLGQLYDLNKDPAELNNVWSEHPEIVKRLADLLEKYKREGHSRP